jgi:hypothetical protein
MMISFDRLVLVIILIWISLYTVSFGWWTWKKKNRLGAVMIFLVSFAALALPVYTLFFREG